MMNKKIGLRLGPSKTDTSLYDEIDELQKKIEEGYVSENSEKNFTRLEDLDIKVERNKTGNNNTNRNKTESKKGNNNTNNDKIIGDKIINENKQNNVNQSVIMSIIDETLIKNSNKEPIKDIDKTIKKMIDDKLNKIIEPDMSTYKKDIIIEKGHHLCLRCLKQFSKSVMKRHIFENKKMCEPYNKDHEKYDLTDPLVQNLIMKICNECLKSYDNLDDHNNNCIRYLKKFNSELSNRYNDLLNKYNDLINVTKLN